MIFAAATALFQDQEVVRGRKLFDAHCARCHNMGGTGAEGPSLARPTLRHAADEAALVMVIREGIEGTDMPGTWLLSESEAQAIAKYVRTLGRVEPSVLPGNAAKGREIFEGASGCGNCHSVKGLGGVLGPDLSDVGLRRGAAYLRESVVSPAAMVAEGFRMVRIRTREGEDVVGMRLNEDTFTLQVRDQVGRIHSFSKLELEELERLSGESLMPSYGTELSASELDDLVSYLASLRDTP
jgi:putative heme-binding domain-containing protein